MKASFSGAKAVEEQKFCSPGVIDVFTISDIEFGENDNGNEYFTITFNSDKEGSFREYMYLSEKAIGRFMYLYEKVNDTTPPDDENAIMAALKGKKVALLVSGKVNEQSGKGYASLPYAGFARKPEAIGELSISNSEQKKIDAALEAIARSAAAESNGNGEAPAQSDADSF